MKINHIHIFKSFSSCRKLTQEKQTLTFCSLEIMEGFEYLVKLGQLYLKQRWPNYIGSAFSWGRGTRGHEPQGVPKPQVNALVQEPPFT
jgi:hypothetical protein